jgi:hypothetical protein
MALSSTDEVDDFYVIPRLNVVRRILSTRENVSVDLNGNAAFSEPKLFNEISNSAAFTATSFFAIECDRHGGLP